MQANFIVTSSFPSSAQASAGPDSHCLLSAATQYLAAGLCVVPAQKDKRPALPAWAIYQQQSPIAPYVGAETTTAKIFALFEDADVPKRTLEFRMHEAHQAGYIKRGTKRGQWSLGAKPLSA